MFFTSWQLALITLIVMPFLLIVSYIFRQKVRLIYRAIRQQVSKMNTFLNEFISGIATIKLFSQEQILSQKFDEINKEHNRLQVKTVLYYSLFFPVIEMLSAATLGLILWFSGVNILSNEITIGVVIAFMQYAEMFFRPIRDLTEKYTTLQSAMASAERIFTTLDTTDTTEEKPDSLTFDGLCNKIEFKNVSFSYDGTKPVLKNVSLTITKGETIAIVGHTGSGKTTLINLLCSFYDIQDGEILLDGINIKNYNQQSLRRQISLVMQDVFLFSRTVEENITLGSNSISNDKVKKIATMLGADKFISQLNNKYSEKLIERGDSLSFGQRQLIAFCRALAFEPSILILDEATSNIDSETEQIIEAALEKLISGRTSIIIAHRLSTIKRADKIIVLHHGEVREIGTHEELLKRNGIYSRLYWLQEKGMKFAV
jgi:ATP-binding cassette subfamily B protein